MGFVMRLNSRDLVNDPKNGAEVYPITATNAVYRAGTDKNLEQILSELSNSADRKVIQNLEYLSNTNTLQISYTDNTTDNIQLLNWVRNVAVTKNDRTYTITVTPTTGSASTYTIELPNVTTSGSGNGLSDISYNSSTNTITATKSNFVTDVQIEDSRGGVSKVTNGVAEIPDFPVTLEINQSDFFISDTEGITHSISGTTALGNSATTSGNVYPARLVTQGSGNAITSLAYSRDNDATKLNRLNLNVYKGNFLTDITCASGSDINTVGTPSVTSSINGSTTTLTFHQLKGAKGDNATITNVTASVDSGTGTPSVDVSIGGTPSARTFDLQFHNLKGTNGVPGKDAETTVYDCNVSSETEFNAAVATSWIGQYTESIQGSWLYSTPSGPITIDDVEVTPKKAKVRIHIVGNFTMYFTNYDTYGLENCEVHGDHHTITLNRTMKLVGYGCDVQNTRFILHNNSQSDSEKFNINGQSGQHSYFSFAECQFNRGVSDDDFMKIKTNSSTTTIDIKIRDCNFNGSGANTCTSSSRVKFNFNQSEGPILFSIFNTLNMSYDKGNKSETNRFNIANYYGDGSSGTLRIFYDKLISLWDNNTEITSDYSTRQGVTTNILLFKAF